MSEPRANELLGIALEVLEEGGLENLGVGTISRRAGIKPPSLYKQFASKADIEQQLSALGFRLWAQQLATATEAVPPAASRRDRIATIAYSYRSTGLAHPQLFRLMYARPFPGPLVAAVGPTLPVDYGELFPDVTAGMTFWAWGHGLLGLEIAGRFPPEVNLDEMWETLVNTVAGGR